MDCTGTFLVKQHFVIFVIRGSDNKWFPNAIIYSVFDYIVYTGVGSDSIAVDGWKKALSNNQLTAAYVLDGVALLLVLIIAFLLYRVFMSSYTMEFFSPTISSFANAENTFFSGE